MIENLIRMLIVALVLLLAFYICSWFISGMILQIIGAILALCFILFVVRLFGIV